MDEETLRLVITSASTLIAALGATALGNHHSRKTEHKQWVRNEKRVAYGHARQLILKYDQWVRKFVEGDATDMQSRLHDFIEYGDIDLVASKKVYGAFLDYLNTVNQLVSGPPSELMQQVKEKFAHKKYSEKDLEEAVRELHAEKGISILDEQRVTLLRLMKKDLRSR